MNDRKYTCECEHDKHGQKENESNQTKPNATHDKQINCGVTLTFGIPRWKPIHEHIMEHNKTKWTFLQQHKKRISAHLRTPNEHNEKYLNQRYTYIWYKWSHFKHTRAKKKDKRKKESKKDHTITAYYFIKS